MKISATQETLMPKKKPWTVIVYLAADNNLTNFGVDSLKQMKNVADPSVNIVAEFDSGPKEPTRRYVFDGTGSPFGSIDENLIGSSGEINAGDPTNLTAFIEWADTCYPADHYFTIIWGHGAGVNDSFPRAPDRSFVTRHHLLNGTPRKNGSNGSAVFLLTKALAFVDHPKSYLTNLGLKKGLERASQTIGRKLDLVGMDACNMNMIEIGYQIHRAADFLVASQDEIPDASWPYDRLLKELVRHPDMTPFELASTAASTYLTAYRDYINQPVALSTLDLSFSPDIARLFSDLIDVLMTFSKDTHVRGGIERARANVRSFQEDIAIDLIHFCQLLCQYSHNRSLVDVAHAFIAQFRQFISVNDVTRDEYNCNGTSVYFPKDHFGEFYEKVDFSRATRWGEFLKRFLHRGSNHNHIIQHKKKGAQNGRSRN